MQGQLLGIFIAEQKGQTMKAVNVVEALVGEGIRGDRYLLGDGIFSKSNKKSRDITLIEIESVWALERDYQITVDPQLLRRNLLTKDIALNHFVARRLQIGDVVVEGVELCEPCGYLSNMLDLPLKEALKHRGGLRCRIIHGGKLEVGQIIKSS